ncbi:MAG: hypothetical protein NXI31_12945 [bacterium]|nr:hypothetical protein [bacterium]
MAPNSRILALLVTGAAIAAAPGPIAQRPTTLSPREVLATFGAFVDLDAGAILPGPRLGPLVADVRFDRDGKGLYLEPLHGAQSRGRHDVTPDADTWSTDRIRCQRNGHPPATFVRTDQGVARLDATILHHYSVSTVSLRWLVTAAAAADAARFDLPPMAFERAWDGQQLTLTWLDDATQWQIEITHTATGAAPAEATEENPPEVTREVIDEPRLVLAELADDRAYRVRVWGLRDGIASVPGQTVIHGRPRAAVRGHTDFDGRWFERGGLRLTPAAAAVDGDADIVFFLYGIYVPGGGVVKLGSGEAAYLRGSRLPNGPHPCVHSRLERDDVLAVQLRDGRWAKIWLQAQDGRDLRNGMRVQHTFLGDGRQSMQQRPTAVSAKVEDGVVTVSWPAVPGAMRYLVEADGRPPVTTTRTTLRWPALPDRLFEVRLYAESALGERSTPARARAHTYGGGARLGTAVLVAMSDGIEFASGKVGRNPPWDLAITGGAGGSSSLSFRAAGTIEPAGKRGFADFSDLDPDNGRARWDSDDRQQGCNRLYVHTPDGGCASVLILERGWPNTKIEYLWLPRLPERK